MNRNVGIATVIGIVIIIGVISFQMYESSYERSTVDEYYSDKTHEDEKNIKHVVYPENPQTLRGLTINKDKYLIGENVFMRINNIPMGLKDNLQVFTPQGIKYINIPFDGNEKDSFKHYFRPSLLKQFHMCDKEQLIGKWTIQFEGLPNEKLNFQVLDEILPHSEEYYVSCNENPLELPIVQPSLDE
jgi:hypothetical protein|tara:strand:- start:220 stop:780 length:561 start_codon:yes stop_codon:yes gene_type:complete